MEKVASVYTLLMKNIYLSLSTQVDEGTVFRKHTVDATDFLIGLIWTGVW